MAARRRSSLQKCPQNRSEQRRRCFTNWVVVFLILTTVYCIITNYLWHWEHSDAANKAILNRGDELLTTSLISTERDDIQRLGVASENSNIFAASTVRNSLESDCVRKKGFVSQTSARVIQTYKELFPHAIRYHFIIPSFSSKVVTYTYSINTSNVEVYQVEAAYPMVKTGGYYQPANCSAKSKIAIIVPYRGLQTDLGIFLNNIHPFMIAQQVEYQIFIIEQSGLNRFNKGRLYNVGFIEVTKLNRFSCIVFHEVNLLPTNSEIKYSCSVQPQVISTSFDESELEKLGDRHARNSTDGSSCHRGRMKQFVEKKRNRRMTEETVHSHNATLFPFKKSIALFGGVVSMTVEMILKVNGYSNNLFCQDKNMMWRLNAVGYHIVRLHKTIGVFKVLPHRVPVGRYRVCSARAVKRYKTDGLSNIKYVVKSKRLRRLYTHIVVDITRQKRLKINKDVI